MDISVKELDQKGYMLKEKLKHEEIIPFVQRVFNQPNLMTRTYFYITLLSVALFFFFITRQLINNVSFGTVILQISWSIIITLLLIPVHEGIHGLVYKLLGAPKVTYTADFKRFIFTAQADNFIVNEREFYYLAFAPFAIISTACLLVLFVYPNYSIIAIGILAFHTMACGGDFGLAAFFYEYTGIDMVTFDNVDAKESYFYVRYPENKAAAEATQI